MLHLMHISLCCLCPPFAWAARNAMMFRPSGLFHASVSFCWLLGTCPPTAVVSQSRPRDFYSLGIMVLLSAAAAAAAALWCLLATVAGQATKAAVAQNHNFLQLPGSAGFLETPTDPHKALANFIYDEI